MENKEVNKFNKTFSALMDSMKHGKGKRVKQATGKIMRYAYLILMLLTATTAYRLLSSDYAGDFKVYEHNHKTGVTEILRFKAKKTTPPIKVENLLSLEYHSDGGKGFDYKRRVGELLSFQVFMGGGASVKPGGEIKHKGGVSLGF